MEQKEDLKQLQPLSLKCLTWGGAVDVVAVKLLCLLELVGCCSMYSKVPDFLRTNLGHSRLRAALGVIVKVSRVQRTAPFQPELSREVAVVAVVVLVRRMSAAA